MTAFDTYTFSEAITLANTLMALAFNARLEHEAMLAATYASKWFIKAEEARETGTVRGEAFFRTNYLCVKSTPEPMPKPTTGTLYERPGNDGIRALVIDAIRPLDGGWLCVALLLCECGTPLSVQQIVLTCDDAPAEQSVTVAEGLAQLRQIHITRKLAYQEAQRAAFLATLEGRAASSYTPAEYAEAKRLHIVLQEYRDGCKGWDGPLLLVLPGMVR